MGSTSGRRKSVGVASAEIEAAEAARRLIQKSLLDAFLATDVREHFERERRCRG